MINQTYYEIICIMVYLGKKHGIPCKTWKEFIVVIEPFLMWNLLITLVIAPLAWYIKTQRDEIKRIDILLNKTREQYMNKVEHKDDINRLFEHLSRLENKIDTLLTSKWYLAFFTKLFEQITIYICVYVCAYTWGVGVGGVYFLWFLGDLVPKKNNIM